MDVRTAQRLAQLNTRFYAEHAASFSATRSAPWEGWRRVVGLARKAGALEAADGDPATVLDVAAGNLRFERFLLDACPNVAFDLHAVDNCTALAPRAGTCGARLWSRNVAGALLRGENPLEGLLHASLVVCFGFFHHVPGAGARRALMDALVGAAAPEGVVAVSLWRFMDDERLAAKARLADAQAPADLGALDPGDHFLGWQDDARPLRYCHSFDENEVDALAADASLRARELARFDADGRNGRLNRYLVLQRA